MDGKHNLHLVDSYPEPQLQPTSHIQHYLATVRWGMVARRSRGPTAASRKAVDVLQQYLRKCELELARRGVVLGFLQLFSSVK